MADKGWHRKFEDPIPLSGGRNLVTLRDAAQYTSPACRKRKPSCQIGKSQCRRCCWCREGADRGHEGVEQKRFAVRDRWRAFASLWHEIARYDPPFHLDVSVGFLCRQAYRAKMKEHRKRLETLLLDADDFELIAKLAKLLPYHANVRTDAGDDRRFKGRQRCETRSSIRA